MVFGRNPEKLEQKAVTAENRGKTAKAAKYREKAAKIRASHGAHGGAAGAHTHTTAYTGPAGYNTGLATGVHTGGVAPVGLVAPIVGTVPVATTGFAGAPVGGFQQFTTYRTVDRYEQNALKWEQRGNWNKAQKNREKVWRLQNPHYDQQYLAPQFYESNRFLGYNVPYHKESMMAPLGAHMGGVHTTTTTATTTQHMPAITETHVRPTIVEQTTRAEKIVEVQPIIHREIDAPQVHVIEKHIHEHVPSTGPSTVTNQAIIQETVRPRVIEEIQPVIHREVPQTFVERVEQHVTEHITNPTITTKHVENNPTVGIVQGPGPVVHGATHVGPGPVVLPGATLVGPGPVVHGATHVGPGPVVVPGAAHPLGPGPVVGSHTTTTTHTTHTH